MRQEFFQGQFGKDARIVVWRQAYRKFGGNPHDYRFLVEVIVRRVVKGEEIRHINKLVDLYNSLSLKYVVPVGGEDLSAVKGDIGLNFTQGNESFIPLGEARTERPDKRIVLVIEGLPPAGKEISQ